MGERHALEGAIELVFSSEFIRKEVLAQTYEISTHANAERIEDGLLWHQLEEALLNCEILETYPDDPRGPSCLVLGFTRKRQPVHLVCGLNLEQHLVIITVYIPARPKWDNPKKRSQSHEGG